MPRIFEWLGSLMFLVALLEFIPNPKKALQSIPDVLATNPRMVNGHLILSHPDHRTGVRHQKNSQAQWKP